MSFGIRGAGIRVVGDLAPGGGGGSPTPPPITSPVVSYGAASSGTQYLHASVDSVTYAPSLVSGSPATSYAIDQVAPLGMGFSTTTGILAGTPTIPTVSAGIYSITPHNSAGFGPTVSITIHVGRSPNPVYTGSPYTVVAGSVVSEAVQDDDISFQTTYLLTTGSLPSGLSVNELTGTIEGTVAVGADAGSPYTFKVTGYNPWNIDGVESATVTMNVSPAPDPWDDLVLTTMVIKRAYIVGRSTVWSDVAKTTPVTADNSDVKAIQDLTGGDDLLWQSGATPKLTYDGMGSGSRVVKMPLNGSFKSPVMSSFVDFTTPSGRITQYLVFEARSLTRPNAPNGINFLLMYAGDENSLLTMNDNTGPPPRFLFSTQTPLYDPADTDPHMMISTHATFAYGKGWMDGDLIVSVSGGWSNDAGSEVSVGLPNGGNDAVEWYLGAVIIADDYDVADDGAIQAMLQAYFSALPTTAPVGLTLSVDEASFPTGVAITPITASIIAGIADAYSVSPALPTGLSINAGNGTVSGTPTSIVASTTYTVTATNTGTGQSTSTPLVIETFERFNPGIPDEGGF